MEIKLIHGTVYLNRLCAGRKPLRTIQKIFGIERALRDAATGSFTPEEAEKIRQILAINREFLSFLGQDNNKVTRAVYEGTHWRFTPLFESEQPLRRQEFNLADLASIISLPHNCGLALFLIAKRLKCNKILELGTGLGISSSYFLQALTIHGGFLDTIEWSEVCLRRHPKIFSSFPSNLYKVWHGNTQVIMPRLLRSGGYDLVLLDASHLAPAVKFQIECAMSSFLSGGMLLIDDIDWSGPMRALWQDVKNRGDVVYTAEIWNNSLPRLGVAVKF